MLRHAGPRVRAARPGPRPGAAQHRRLRALSHLTSIVTDCATCGSTLRDYGALLADDDDWAARAAAFSSRVRDVSEFLADIPLEKPAGTHRGAGDLPRSLSPAPGTRRVGAAARALGSIDGLEFVELPEADWCCGSAGSQLITHYETSLKVMQRKIDNLASTGAAVIASGCPGCQMQLNTGIRRRGPLRPSCPSGHASWTKPTRDSSG